MKRYFLLVLVSMIGAQLLFAQTKSTIYGTVVDQNNRPISDISVSIEGTSIGTLTDEKGQYTISLPKGEYTLVASSIEYESQKKKISITDIGKKRVNITLGEKVHGLDEVMVYGKSTPQKLREGAFSMNVIQIDKLANTSSNVNQILRQTTGVSIREDGGVGSDFTFKINGLDAKIFIDGVPMENFGSSMSINNIPVNLVERIEIYKGVVPAYLVTDVLGGAVNIITKRKDKKFLDLSYGYGSFNTHQASIVGNYSNHKTGLTVKTNGFYNYSDNDYTMYSNKEYNISIEKVENGHYVPMDKAKRFHDRYHSIMGQLEVGFENKKWADQFLLGFLYSANNKQNQLGATINAVKGGQWSESKYIMPTLTYKKNNFLTKGLYAYAYLSYSKNTVNVQDTATYNYDWTGKWVVPHSTTLDKSHMKYVYDNLTSRFNFNYDLNDSKTQSLNLNYNFNTTKQRNYDMMMTSFEKTYLPSRLGRHIGGIAWQSQWFKNKLISIISFKYYGLHANKTIDERVLGNNNTVLSGDIVKYKKNFNYYSGSWALRYFIQESLGLKFSVEKAYNLPAMTQLFGDGQNYLSNWDLKPEQSKNLNIGAFYSAFINKVHYLNFDVSGFYRKASNYISTKIVSKGSKDQYQYYNEPGVNLYGLEMEVKYGYKDLLQLSANGTYDKAINNKKYTDETNSQVSLTYKDQLPNRPWLYGNVNMTLSKQNLLGRDTRIELTWLFQYVHWYYLSWEGLGIKQSKDFIPSQTVHSAILGYSWKKDKYNVSFEVRNLTNELCYDNFRLQKPGRAFYVKYRMSIF